MSHSTNEATTPEGGYTELHDFNALNPAQCLEAAYKLGEDTTPSASWATARPAAIIAIEIAVVAAVAAAWRALVGVGL